MVIYRHLKGRWFQIGADWPPEPHQSHDGTEILFSILLLPGSALPTQNKNKNKAHTKQHGKQTQKKQSLAGSEPQVG